MANLIYFSYIRAGNQLTLGLNISVYPKEGTVIAMISLVE
jgi:hypothetical protein